MAAVPLQGPAGLTTGSLYRRHARQIRTYCLCRLGSPEDADDAMQSTFLNVHRAFQRGVLPEHEVAWLYKIAHNVCLTKERAARRRRRVESSADLAALQDALPARAVETYELRDLSDALAAMPASQRRVLLLREWQGLSYRELAAELDLSQAAVETLLFRARRSLAAGLERSDASRDEGYTSAA